MGAPLGNWLSLKVSDPSNPLSGGKPGVFISVPKKVVRLAKDRNRLKRLIREALRAESAPKIFPDKKVYYLRVLKKPVRPGLEDARKEIGNLAWPR